MSAAADVIAYAELELGKPYVFGDEGPNTFDCSGLMQWIFAKVGVQLPRIADQQQRFATPVKNPLPGDLVFFGDPAYHVGLYIGGGKMIDAPHRGANVRIDTVYNPSGYGRVPGVGSALAPAFGAIAGVGSTVGGWLGGARHIALEIAFVGLGLALAGYGLYRTVKPRNREG